MGRDSLVGVATRYGLDGPGIESRWGRVFPNPFRPALWPTQPPIEWVWGLFPGVKWPVRCVDHPPHLAPRLRNEGELYCTVLSPCIKVITRIIIL
jgi:hypothetical protein